MLNKIIKSILVSIVLSAPMQVAQVPTTTVAPTIRTTIQTTTSSSSTTTPSNQQEEQEEETVVPEKPKSPQTSNPAQAPSETLLTSTTITTTTIPPTKTTIQENVQILSIPPSCKIFGQIKTFSSIRYICTRNGKTTKWLTVKKRPVRSTPK